MVQKLELWYMHLCQGALLTPTNPILADLNYTTVQCSTWNKLQSYAERKGFPILNFDVEVLSEDPK